MLNPTSIPASHNEVSRLGRHGRSLKDCPVVALQDLQPGAEIVRVSDGRRDAQFGAQEGGAKLRDEFLPRISLAAMAAREVAVETRDMPCPVRLMPISA